MKWSFMEHELGALTEEVEISQQIPEQTGKVVISDRYSKSAACSKDRNY